MNPGGGTSSSGGGWSAGSSSGGFGGYSPGVCGDGMYGGVEQCDDGNTTSGDGCSSACELEPNFVCDWGGEPCIPAACGDGSQQGYLHGDGTYRYEGCDDGNVASGDGCTASCDVEAGWVCPEPGTACREPECGDGFVDFIPGAPGGGGTGGSPGAGGGAVSGGSAGAGGGVTGAYEQCDDGNVASGDGCSASCAVEPGWVCPGAGTACREPACGDGFIDFIPGAPGGGGTGGSPGTAGAGGGGVTGAYEQCDDGNASPGDGCAVDCSVEPGWACYWEGPCHVIVCGDGIADWPSEQCDDGNSTPDDGCTNCQYDPWGTGGSGGSGMTGGSPSTAGGPATGGFGGGFGG